MQNNRFYPHQREEDKGSLFDKKTLCTQTHKKIYSLKQHTPKPPNFNNIFLSNSPYTL